MYSEGILHHIVVSRGKGVSKGNKIIIKALPCIQLIYCVTILLKIFIFTRNFVYSISRKFHRMIQDLPLHSISLGKYVVVTRDV